VAITDEIIGAYQLLGGTCLGCPQSLCLWSRLHFRHLELCYM